MGNDKGLSDQPRGDSLIFEHEWELEKMHRIELVEKVRHILSVREALTNPQENTNALSKLTVSSSRMNLSALTTSPSSPSIPPSTDLSLDPFLDDRQKRLCAKVISLIQSSFKLPAKASERVCDPPAATSQMPVSPGSSPELPSPEAAKSLETWSKPQVTSATCDSAGDKCIPDKTKKIVLVPEVEEVRLSQGVSKKGSILLMAEETRKWTKHWVTIKRPYMFVYRSERDSIETAVINLSDAEIDYAVETDDDLSSSSSEVFSISYKNREYWFKASSAKDAGEWLYSIKPLFAGEIKSKLSRTRKSSHDPANASQQSSD
jgi:kinesin family protein 1